MSNEDYLEHLGLYYSQKIKVLSKHPHYTTCYGMKTKKDFTETENDLTISCSDKKQDILFIVTLSKNIHKENEIKQLLDNLNKGFDGKGYNFEVLNNHNLIKDYDKYLSFYEENKQKIEEIKTKYKELYYNHITKKIEEFYKNRITLLKELNLITFQLKNKADNSIDLRKKYVGLVTQIQNEYLEVQEFIGNITRDEDSIVINKNHLNPFIKVSDGIVEIINENYEELLKPNKPKRESRKNNFGKEDKKLTPEEKSCQDIMCKNKVYDSDDKDESRKVFRKWAVKNHPDKKKGENTEENEQITEEFRIMSNCNDKGILCPQSKKKPEKKKSDKKPDKKKTPDKSTGPVLQLKQDKTDPDEPSPETTLPKKKTLTIDDFKEDMRVEWIHRGKTIQGTVDKINKRKKYKLMIIWDNGDNKEVEINKLKIIED